jgi:cytochrome c
MRRLVFALVAGLLPTVSLAQAAPQAKPCMVTLGAGPAVAADVQKGRRAFLKCRACHTLASGEKNLVGPNLWKMFERQPLAAAGYAYSPAFTKASPRWTLATTAAFIEKPTKAMPGTKMIFAGIASAQERADLLAYLQAATGTPLPGCLIP